MSLESLSSTGQFHARRYLAAEFKDLLHCCDLSDAHYLSPESITNLQRIYGQQASELLSDLGGLASAW